VCLFFAGARAKNNFSCTRFTWIPRGFSLNSIPHSNGMTWWYTDGVFEITENDDKLQRETDFFYSDIADFRNRRPNSRRIEKYRQTVSLRRINKIDIYARAKRNDKNNRTVVTHALTNWQEYKAPCEKSTSYYNEPADKYSFEKNGQFSRSKNREQRASISVGARARAGVYEL